MIFLIKIRGFLSVNKTKISSQIFWGKNGISGLKKSLNLRCTYAIWATVD